MKLKIAYIYMVAICLIAIIPAHSQSSEVKIVNELFLKADDQLTVKMDLVFDDLFVESKKMLILTPVLTSNQNKVTRLTLPSVIVSGKNRAKIIERKKKFKEELPFKDDYQSIIVRKNKTEQYYDYTIALPFEDWMQDASIVLDKISSGCADCANQEEQQLIARNILEEEPPAPVEPEVIEEPKIIEPVTYQLTYIEPEVEPVKNRRDVHTATFNFIVDKFDLLRDYGKNTDKLNEVDDVVGEIHDKEYLKITEVNIAGYASPEGSASHNRMLATNRVTAFADYLLEKFILTSDQFNVSSSGEDWEGLAKAVRESNLKDKDAILDIIDRIEDVDARDAYLKRLSGGTTYQTLLTQYYPPLRRTEYSIAYVVRGFDVMEAREMIKVNPKLLSLNEMYLVARSYPSGSKECTETMDLALQLYPDDAVAIINSAAAYIESGYFEYAINRLNKISDNPKAWNNIGYAYMKKGNKNKAVEFFTKAADAGDKNAIHNLESIKKTL